MTRLSKIPLVGLLRQRRAAALACCTQGLRVAQKASVSLTKPLGSPASTSFSMDAFASESGQDPQIFAQYRVWNPECLMAVRPVQPKFRSQRDETQWQLVNEGGVAIEMLPRQVAEKKLDVANKVVFRLYINEIAHFFVSDPSSPLSFSHTLTHADDNKTTKDLTITPSKDGKEVYFKIVYSDPNEKSLEVTVSAAEFFVIKNLMLQSMQQISGWSYHFEPKNFTSRSHAFVQRRSDQGLEGDDY